MPLEQSVPRLWNSVFQAFGTLCSTPSEQFVPSAWNTLFHCLKNSWNTFSLSPDTVYSKYFITFAPSSPNTYIRMKKLLALSLVTLALLSASCSQKELTPGQKEKDFLYLYETMEANYPYFYIGKNKSGIDWLANKDQYLEKVRATPNDSAYIRALEEIIADLRSGHVDLTPSSMNTL